MRDPAGEKLPLDPAHGHARHVSRPAEEAAVVVLVHGGDAEALVQLLKWTAMGITGVIIDLGGPGARHAALGGCLRW